MKKRILNTNENENTGIGHDEENFAFQNERQAGCILTLSSAILTSLTQTFGDELYFSLKLSNYQLPCI